MARKIIAALLEIVVLIKARRRGRQQNRITLLGIARRGRNCACHITANLMIDIAQMQRKPRRFAPDHVSLAHAAQLIAQTVKPAFLGQPAADPADILERLQSLACRIDIRGFAVIDVRHPVNLGDHLRAVRQTLEACKCCLNHSWRQPHGAARGIGGGCILMVMRAR